ncbi:hypothetical protein [Pararhizobium sp.]|uniref:hypothetical protein n=1 Tax=Pararhizobium sp. TaxID=1977563 RepID=UPI00271C61EE|nr:hypothetical protein [Pararhizobium sp.]MDO9418865.1 hypothetical protein [Pararhizobium sp.]
MVSSALFGSWKKSKAPPMQNPAFGAGQSSATSADQPLVSAADLGIEHNATFGILLEKSQQSSQDLLIQLKNINESTTSLVDTHNQTLSDIGQFRVEHAKVSAKAESALEQSET